MKHLKKIITTFSAIFISLITLAQSGTPISEMYLKGKYTASCATEVLDHASWHNCQLCPFVIDPNDKSKGETKDIEMTFQNDSITFNQNGKITTVPYKRNPDTHAFSFTLGDKQYNFRMFLYNKQRIIEDSDGMILVLDKVN